MAKLIEIGGKPVNRAERAMIKFLANELPDHYRVVPNVVLRQRGQQPYECDAIVVAPHATYVVEIKGWSGTVQQVNSNQWRLDSGRYVDNPLSVNDKKAKVLAGMLDNADISDRNGRHLRRPYVQSCLLSAGTDTVFDLSSDLLTHCLTPQHIVTYLQDPYKIDGGRIERNRYRHCLDALTRYIAGTAEGREPEDRTYGNYRVEDIVDVTDDISIFLARHSQLDDNRVYRIRSWYLSAYELSEEEREDRLEVLKRSAESLVKIGGHPNLVDFKDFGQQENEFYEITEWSDRGTLDTAISQGKTSQMPAARRLEILIGIARGLEAAQKAGVFHRNLNPSVILLGPDGQPKIGDFDRAFLSDAERTVYGTEYRPKKSDYVPPELAVTNYDVFDNTDVYSLGIIAFEMFTMMIPSMMPDALTSDISEVPEDIKDEYIALVESMISNNPNDRPENPSAVVTELEAMLALLQGELVEAFSPAPQPEEPNAADEESEPTLDELSDTAEPLDVTSFEPGDTVANSYLVVDRLGEGATSSVYLVASDILQGDYALKIADPNLTDDLDGPLREFNLLRDIGHPNIVHVEWAGRIGSDPETAPSYLLMEHLEGDWLDAYLSADTVDEETAVEWTLGLLSALEALHACNDDDAGILHRDIKPANILISERGPVLADFSSACRASEDRNGPGTLRYAPPDLGSSDGGGSWNASGDLFSAGCVLYEMLSGKRPWGDSAPSLSVDPVGIRDVASVDGRLAEVVDRAVAPRREDRFQRATDFADALRNATSRQPTQYHATPNVESTMSEARTELWTSDFVDDLTRSAHARAVLHRALRNHAYREEDVLAADLEAEFLNGEARAMALERPLPDVLSSFYDTLLEPAAPLAVFDADATPEQLAFEDGDTLVVVDGLTPFEAAKIAASLHGANADTTEYTWVAGATDPSEPEETEASLERAFVMPPDLVGCDDVDELEAAIDDGQPGLRLQLQAGRRGDEGLAHLLEKRAATIQRLTAAVLGRSSGTVFITTTFGCVYLGHGLRRDVGAGFGDNADRIRARWQSNFGKRRIGEPKGKLDSNVFRPLRDTHHDSHARRFPVGRLAWPDPPDAPRLASGGLSIPERLLPLIVFSQ